MKVEEYTIGFQYGVEEYPVGKKNPHGHEPRIKDEKKKDSSKKVVTVNNTTCRIFRDVPGIAHKRELVAEAIIGNHSLDVYNKEKGRRIALTRALERLSRYLGNQMVNVQDIRNLRSKIWAKYDGSKPGGRFAKKTFKKSNAVH